ncbi:MAG: hypothetical protein PHW02_02945 [bacterium]|nr:hypothetical protein [bacterium]
MKKIFIITILLFYYSSLFCANKELKLDLPNSFKKIKFEDLEMRFGSANTLDLIRNYSIFKTNRISRDKKISEVNEDKDMFEIYYNDSLNILVYANYPIEWTDNLSVLNFISRDYGTLFVEYTKHFYNFKNQATTSYANIIHKRNDLTEIQKKYKEFSSYANVIDLPLNMHSQLVDRMINLDDKVVILTAQQFFFTFSEEKECNAHENNDLQFVDSLIKESLIKDKIMDDKPEVYISDDSNYSVLLPSDWEEEKADDNQILLYLKNDRLYDSFIKIIKYDVFGEIGSKKGKREDLDYKLWNKEDINSDMEFMKEEWKNKTSTKFVKSYISYENGRPYIYYVERFLDEGKGQYFNSIKTTTKNGYNYAILIAMHKNYYDVGFNELVDYILNSFTVKD